MADEKEQAVAEETEGQAQPAPEESSAQETQTDSGDDLDQLLAEYDQNSSQQPSQQPSGQQTQPDVSKLQQEVESLKAQKAAEMDQKDFDSVVDEMAQNAPVSRTMVAGMVRQLAVDDPKIAEAWEKRLVNPKAWQAAKQRLNKSYSAEIKALADPSLSEDREAVTAAVKSASKKPPEEPEVDESQVRHMSDAQFEQWVKSQKKTA